MTVIEQHANKASASAAAPTGDFDDAVNATVAYECENCGTNPLERFEVPRQTTLWKCTKCGLYQKGQPPTDRLYEDEYHDGYLRSLPRKIRTAQVRLGRAVKYLPEHCKSPSVLDVGCSIGATVSAAARRGWDAHGVDVSRSAVDSCRIRGLNCVHYGGDRLPFADKTFDILTSWHVIEHVENVSTVLDDWYRVLKPGGIMVLETPHANCWKARTQGAKYAKFWPAAHIYTFTPDTLEPFAARCGFEVLPNPWFAAPTSTGLATTTYALAYQAFLATSRATGFAKAFQLFARRPATDASERKQAA